jgi:hypothetical protein
MNLCKFCGKENKKHISKNIWSACFQSHILSPDEIYFANGDIYKIDQNIQYAFIMEKILF